MSTKRCMGGRKAHPYYGVLLYDFTKLDNGKAAAYCRVCARILKNTSQQRMKQHRYETTLLITIGIVPRTNALRYSKYVLFAIRVNPAVTRQSVLPDYLPHPKPSLELTF